MEKEKKKKNKKSGIELWLSVAEAAKVGGVNTKTIRRGIKDGLLKYRIVKDRYQISFPVLIKYLNRNIKLKNKLQTEGLGQYVKEWNWE